MSSGHVQIIRRIGALVALLCVLVMPVSPRVVGPAQADAIIGGLVPEDVRGILTGLSGDHALLRPPDPAAPDWIDPHAGPCAGGESTRHGAASPRVRPALRGCWLRSAARLANPPRAPPAS